MNGLIGFRILIAVSTWLLTFAIHGIVMHAVALAAGRTIVRSPRLRSALWRSALLLPIVTATIATTGWRPVAPIRDLNIPDFARSSTPPNRGKAWVVQQVVRRSDKQEQLSSFATNTRALDLAAIVIALSIVSALIGLGRLLARRRAFERRIGARVPRPDCDGELPSGYRLTASATLGAPVALGAREICVPANTFARLMPAERRSVLAHEAAHLARRDPLWFAVGDFLVGLFPWQPLARPLMRAMRRDAEFCCDDAVMQLLGNGHALVRSLAVFAAEFDPAETALAASCGGSPLELRVRRILGPRPAVRRLTSVLITAGFVVTAAGAAAALPVVSTRTVNVVRPALGAHGAAEERVILLERE